MCLPASQVTVCVAPTGCPGSPPARPGEIVGFSAGGGTGNLSSIVPPLLLRPPAGISSGRDQVPDQAAQRASPGSTPGQATPRLNVSVESNQAPPATGAPAALRSTAPSQATPDQAQPNHIGFGVRADGGLEQAGNVSGPGWHPPESGTLDTLSDLDEYNYYK